MSNPDWCEKCFGTVTILCDECGNMVEDCDCKDIDDE